MSGITSHILDISRGRPAPGVMIVLDAQDAEGGWRRVFEGPTNDDGRVADMVEGWPGYEPGVYRLSFATSEYFDRLGIDTFYPHIEVIFEIRDTAQHFHVPLLVSPFGYSTYRGS